CGTGAVSVFVIGTGGASGSGGASGHTSTVTHLPQFRGVQRPHLLNIHLFDAAFVHDPFTDVLWILVHHHPLREIHVRLSALWVSRHMEFKRSSLAKAQPIVRNMHHD